MKKIVLHDKSEVEIQSHEGLWNIAIPLKGLDEVKVMLARLTPDNLKSVTIMDGDVVEATYTDVLLQQPLSITTEPSVTLTIGLRTKSVEEQQKDMIDSLQAQLAKAVAENKETQDQLTQLQEAMAEIYEASIGEA